MEESIFGCIFERIFQKELLEPKLLAYEGITWYFIKKGLLPSGSKQHEVLLFGSIQEGILQAHLYIVQTEKKTLKLV